MTCRHCEALRQEIARLKEEVRAWEEYDRQDGRVDADEERLVAWRTVYGFYGVGPVLALMALCDRQGRLLNRDALIRATRSGGVKAEDDVHRSLAPATICKLRALLRGVAASGRLPETFRGPTGGIVTHWGQGWTMTAENAAAVRALAGEA